MDLECGLHSVPAVMPHSSSINSRGNGSKTTTWASSVTTGFKRFTFRNTLSRNEDGRELARSRETTRTIEEYPDGYPQYSALTASHYSFHIYRRFSYLRTRLLLYKQDNLSVLQERLEDVDRSATIGLRLGSHRRDNNEQRKTLIKEIDVALADYDSMLERDHRMLAYERAKSRAVTSLRDWIEGAGSISREETKYLSQLDDLLQIAMLDDSASLNIRISRNLDVHHFSPTIMTLVARVLIMPPIILLLMVPVIICSFVSSLAGRLITIILSTSLFITVLSILSKARSVELVVAGATYTTVLVIFISGST
ncbi:hypothetical protein DL770_000914 [Monosporascus sp. CRB-9-2]|nr:hypothetical protein DL770_000914 [Monosporascus sp. CRB-9-2]